MPTECISDSSGFSRVEGGSVAAAFDRGTVTSDAGARRLGAAVQRWAEGGPTEGGV